MGYSLGWFQGWLITVRTAYFVTGVVCYNIRACRVWLDECFLGFEVYVDRFHTGCIWLGFQVLSGCVAYRLGGFSGFMFSYCWVIGVVFLDYIDVTCVY